MKINVGDIVDITYNLFEDDPDRRPMPMSFPGYVLEVTRQKVLVETRLSPDIRANSWHKRSHVSKLSQKCKEIAERAHFYIDPPLVTSANSWEPDILPFEDIS